MLVAGLEVDPKPYEVQIGTTESFDRLRPRFRFAQTGHVNGLLSFLAAASQDKELNADVEGFTQMHADRAALDGLSGRVIGCAYTVLNALGVGFAEKVYENALVVEMQDAGLAIMQQYGFRVLYHDAMVGEYFPDLLVDGVLLVELKTVKALDDIHRMQCTNYLKATGLRLCLLLNFGNPRLEIKRVVLGL